MIGKAIPAPRTNQHILPLVLMAGLALVTASASGWARSLHASPANRPPSPAIAARAAETAARLTTGLPQLPLYFVENQGQLDPRVAYSVQGSGRTVHFTSHGITFLLSRRAQVSELPASLAPSDAETVGDQAGQESDSPWNQWVLKLDFVGSKRRDVAGRPRSDGGGSELLQRPARPVEYRSAGLRLPGLPRLVAGDRPRPFGQRRPAQVHLRRRALGGPRRDPHGLPRRHRGPHRRSRPAGGCHPGRLSVRRQAHGVPGIRRRAHGNPASYRLEVDPDRGAYAYGFELGAYDNSRPLIIDPALLIYAGYIGGTAADEAFGVAVDTEGNAYVSRQDQLL